MKKKGQVMWDDIKKFVIAGLVLIVMVGGYFLLHGKLGNIFEFIKNFLRFGG